MNEAVLKMVGNKRDLLRVARKRQLRFFGHVIREGMENLIVTRMVEGRRRRGRPRDKYIDWLVKLVRGRMLRGQFVRAMHDREMEVPAWLEGMAQLQGRGRVATQERPQS